VQRHGTTYEQSDRQLVRVIDRTGVVHAELSWVGRTLDRLVVTGATVRGAVIADPLLGDAHQVEGLTTMSAIDWARPTRIPAIAAPGRLTAGSGGAILNLIAVLAARENVPALHYAGPYPTPALFHTLARSFRTDATEAAFTADVTGRGLRLARDELPFDFIPAPHERISIPHGYVELRERLERAVIDGTSYEPGGSPARLTANGVGTHAEIWFGDAPWAHVATFGADGSMVDGPHPIPACTSDVIGREFPLALRAAIAELVGDAVPGPLSADARSVLIARPLRWADLGARAARHDASGFAVHAALWERIGPLGLSRLALAIAEALVPVAVSAVVADLGQWPGLMPV
jgi:hypothetical protein